MTCCLESKPRIGSASLDFSCAAEYQLLYSKEYHFWAALLLIENWYLSRRLKFRKSAILLRYSLRLTSKLSVMVWYWEWQQGQESHLFNQWDPAKVTLKLPLLTFYHQESRCLFNWESVGNPIQLWLIHTLCLQCFWNTRHQSQCWT